MPSTSSTIAEANPNLGGANMSASLVSNSCQEHISSIDESSGYPGDSSDAIGSHVDGKTCADASMFKDDGTTNEMKMEVKQQASPANKPEHSISCHLEENKFTSFEIMENLPRSASVGHVLPNHLRTKARQSHINIVDGKKSSVILAAKGEAEAIIVKSQTTAEGLRVLSEVMEANGGTEAASLRIAEQYINAFGSITKEGTILLLPTGAANPSSMIAQALSIYKSLNVSPSYPGRIPLSKNGDEIGIGEREMLECEALRRVWDPGIKVISPLTLRQGQNKGRVLIKPSFGSLP